jgi:hypothetical protein
MKKFLFALFLFAAIARGEEIALPDGRVLHRARLSKFYGVEFVIEHDGGMAHIPWAQMPAEWQAKYPLDPDRATKAAKIEQELRALQKDIYSQKEIAAAAEQKRRQLNVRTIVEVSSDVPAFNTKQVSFEGTIAISDYYNWGYRDAASSTYSFEIRDGTGLMHVYIRKVDAQSLREELLKAKKPLRAVVACLVYQYMAGPSDLLAEGVAFYPPLIPGDSDLKSQGGYQRSAALAGTARLR